MSDEILTLDEVAIFLKVGKRTVYRLAAAGEIPAFKLGGSWRFRRSELEAWITKKWLALNPANRRYLCQHIAISFPPPIFRYRYA